MMGEMGGGGAPDIVDRGVEVEREAEAEAVAFKSQAPLQSSGRPLPAQPKAGTTKKVQEAVHGRHAALGPAANQSLDPKRPHLQVSTAHSPPVVSLVQVPVASHHLQRNGRASCRGFVHHKLPDPRTPSPPQYQPASLRLLHISLIESNPNLPSISRRHNQSNSRHHQPTPLRNLTIGTLEPRLSGAVKGRPALEPAFAQTIAHDDAGFGITASPAA